MAQRIREGRYDRMTDDVQRLTGQAPVSLREFIGAQAEAFTLDKPKT